MSDMTMADELDQAVDDAVSNGCGVYHLMGKAREVAINLRESIIVPRELYERMIDALNNSRDTGVSDEGWKSQELTALCNEAEKLLRDE
jgi:hypothetical protein